MHIFLPIEKFIVDYKIDFADTAIGEQSLKLNICSDVFEKDISSARTFGMLSDVENMHKNGLALGGSIDNAIVVDNGNILNPGGLRYQDEFVRHKILDFCGDIYLAGYAFEGSFKAICSGHKLNNKFLARHHFYKVLGHTSALSICLTFTQPKYCWY